MFRTLMVVAAVVALSACPEAPSSTTCATSADCETGQCFQQLCLDPNGDLDDDGLTNTVEAELGSKVDDADSDGDGAGDGDEIGDPSAPTDTDGDRLPDILESSLDDADGDCLDDQADDTNAGVMTAAEKAALFCPGLKGCTGFEEVVTFSCPPGEPVVCDGAAIDTLCAECGVNPDCDDSDGCTVDTCALGLCENTALLAADGGADLDGDGVCDAADSDPDGDGVMSDDDDCPLGETGWTSDASTDNDDDGCQDAAEDDDDDNDGCLDGDDDEPLAAAGDDDDDDLPDDCDACVGDNLTGDADLDGLCDDVDPDIDGDGCLNADDTFPNSMSGDSDGDGIADHCDLCFGDNASGDSDGDGTCDASVP